MRLSHYPDLRFTSSIRIWLMNETLRRSCWTDENWNSLEKDLQSHRLSVDPLSIDKSNSASIVFNDVFDDLPKCYFFLEKEAPIINKIYKILSNLKSARN